MERLDSLPVLDKHTPRCEPVGSSRNAKLRALSLLLFHVVAAVHIAHWKITGSSITPVEPSEAMQTLELGLLNAGFLLFVGLILSTAVLGRFFCGWACHFVAYQDMAGWVLRKLSIKPRPVRSRLLILVPFGAAFYMFLWPTLARMLAGHEAPALVAHLTTEDFWGTFPGPFVTALTVLLDGFLIVYFLGAKGFCTYGCPYGAFFNVAERLAPVGIQVTESCEQCGHCTDVCTSNVRVHEEVAKFGGVVDPGCMKCLDCVSVCPKDALYVGRRTPTVLRLGEITRRKKRAWDFTWVEEVAMAMVFFVGLYAFRGLYEAVPFLLSLGISVCLAMLAVAGWRLLRRRTVTLQHQALRVDGTFTRAGVALVLGLPLLLAFTSHSAVVQHQTREGTRLLVEAESVQGRAQEALIVESLAHLQRASSFGLIPVGSLHLKMGAIRRAQGDLVGAEREMRRAIEIDPSMRTPRLELAEILVRKGDLSGAQAVLEELLVIDPANAGGRRLLERVQAQRRR